MASERIVGDINHERGAGSRNAQNDRGSVVSGPSPYSLNRMSKHAPRNASHSSLYDNNSDIYVTSAAYKAPSEIR